VTVDSDFSKNISVSFILSVSAFNSGEKRGKVIQRELESERNEEAKKMGVQHKQEQSEEIDYTEVVKSNKFQKLISDRKKFIIPYTVFFLIFYFLLPIATSYTTFLNKPAIGDISWIWLFAFAQFVMTFALCIVYVKKSSVFDAQADEIIEEQLDKGRDV